MKAYENRVSHSAMVTRYTIMNVAEACACTAMLLGKIRRHVSDHRLILLIILFNVVAIGVRPLLALYADYTQNKHTGVRLGVMIFALGFLWPVDFGITAKVAITAVGSAIYHAFSSSSIPAKSNFTASGIGFLAAGAVLGTAIGRYAAFYGYLCIFLLMILACPTDKSMDLPEAKENRIPKAPKTALAPLFALGLLLATAAFSYLMTSLDFAWDVNKKTLFLLALAMAFGRGMGGIVSDRLGNLFTLAASLGGGAALLLFCADHKLLALAGVALVSMSIAPTLALLFRLMPAYPGFSLSLAVGAAYLGYVATKYTPLKEGLLPIICGTVLLITATTDIVLFLLGKRARKQTEVNNHA